MTAAHDHASGPVNLSPPFRQHYHAAKPHGNAAKPLKQKQGSESEVSPHFLALDQRLAEVAGG